MEHVSNLKSNGLEHLISITRLQTSFIQLVNVGHLVPNQAKGYLVHPHRASVRSVHSWHRAWFNNCILGFETLAHHPGRGFHDFWRPAHPGMMFFAQDRATNVFLNEISSSEYSCSHFSQFNSYFWHSDIQRFQASEVFFAPFERAKPMTFFRENCAQVFAKNFSINPKLRRTY